LYGADKKVYLRRVYYKGRMGCPGVNEIIDRPNSTTQDLLHLGNDARHHNILHGNKDVIGGMAVERRSESLLVEMVTNEADATTKDEETVQRANLDIFICFFPSECSAVTEKVNKADRDATVDVENELDILVRLHTEPGKCEERTVSFFAVVTVSTARA